MDDLISRQAAIDAILKINDYNNSDRANALGLAEFAITTLPSAQPEIIHCGECTKMEVDSVFHDCWCGETGKKVWINHYCGYAERREVTNGN